MAENNTRKHAEISLMNGILWSDNPHLIITQLKGSVQEADISIYLVFAPIVYLCSTHADLSYK